MLTDYLGIKNFIPHGYCLNWSPFLLGLHVISDVVIVLSYYFIPFIVIKFVRRRDDIPYFSILLMCCAFVIACGTTHLLSIITIWFPFYWLDGFVKLVTAIISLITAIMMITFLPNALKLPSTITQLRAEMIKREQAQIAEHQALELSKESEERLKLVLHGAELGFWDWNISTGEVKRNEIWATMLGYDYEEIEYTTQQWLDFVHPEDRERAWQAIVDALENSTLEYKIEYRMLCKDGSFKWILDHASVMRRDEKGNPTRMCGIHANIHERKEAEIKLQIAAAVFESQEGMFVTDTDCKILQVNRAFTDMTGFSAQEAVNQTPRLFRSGRHDKAFYKTLWYEITTAGFWKGEIWNRRKNGEIYPQWLTITSVKNNEVVTHYVATLIDITERKNNEEQIYQLAFYDPLTNLPNRRLLHEQLKQMISLEKRLCEQTAVLMLDLDKFKAVNDTFGHLAGDELLQQVANRITTRLRSSDIVARLGGDEFILLIHDIENAENLEKISQDIIESLSYPFLLNEGNEVTIGASIGISLYPEHGDNPETLIDKADSALYQAKNNGRGCFAYYSDSYT
jgi:diguanylate cyclase (GGDEF)-like protein/PAS domain S-box-containing protein